MANAHATAMLAQQPPDVHSPRVDGDVRECIYIRISTYTALRVVAADARRSKREWPPRRARAQGSGIAGPSPRVYARAQPPKTRARCVTHNELAARFLLAPRASAPRTRTLKYGVVARALTRAGSSLEQSENTPLEIYLQYEETGACLPGVRIPL